MPPHNRSESSGNPKCPRCGSHFKDLDGHVLRIHKTTLASLQSSQRNNTRQERRNDRLYKKPLLIKQIEGYARILRNQKRNAPKEDEFIFEEKIKWFNKLKEIVRASNEDDLSIFQSIYSDFNRVKKESDDEIKRLREEVEGLRKELEKVKNKLNKLEQVNDADSVLNSNSMRMELDQKDEYIDKLTKQVSELKLGNEERNNLIKNLEDKIEKLTSDIEVFGNNFKMADDERSQNAIKMNDAISKSAYMESKYRSIVAQHETVLKERDLKETDLYSQIELYRNRIAELESKLGNSTRVVTNNEIYEVLDSDTDSR
ncbi:30573_t:CDS:2 [Gigaspora margarita]|uniref:30573_t:CDS:1 n=1 Tax=Gigaspora margarita TaxID=4874 RepID=A0ABN7ULQ5_GIGMA|nr:30573_t:CDS:2 [Gigaspora margarita]